MTLDQYGPTKPCQRTGACVEAGPHLGGVHLDPRHPLYDGPSTTINALPHQARDAARVLLAGGAPVPEVIEMAKEIHRLRSQVAAVSVDKDRQVRAALQRADDCAEHGKDIVQLNEQVHFFDEQARKNDAGRIALLGLLHAVEDLVQAHREERLPSDR
jgi:outer membrane murein-binding lipoprotein Lpp